MDPHANIVEQRLIAARILRVQDECPENGVFLVEQLDELGDLAIRLAELVEALHEWRQKGGFDPYLPGANEPPSPDARTCST